MDGERTAERAPIVAMLPVGTAKREQQPSFYALAQHFAVLCAQLIRDNPPKGAPIWDVVAATVATTRELAATRRGHAGVPCTTPGCTKGTCGPCEERDRLEARVASLEFQREAVGETWAPLRCHGALDENNRPICDGPDVQHVRVTTLSGETFEASYCAECRVEAEHKLGHTVESAPPAQKVGRRVRWRRVWDGAELSGMIVSDYPEHRSVGVRVDGTHQIKGVHLSNVVEWGSL